MLGLAKGALDARDDAKVREALAAVNDKLFDALTAALDIATKASALQSSLDEANAEIVRLKELEDLRKSLDEFQVRPGAFVFARKPSGGAAYDHPYYCHTCLCDGRQTVMKLTGFAEILACSRDSQHNIDLTAHKPHEIYTPPVSNQW
jgi:hypothetical protein